ncbi:50S ribosomal protein L16 [Candidatus Micrarchaeota archaeon]|jgi:large subunit ribosomal protein L10e|nr:50S ribosomal protein L16 [Candidatus Micrarchaeota archaeon]
MGFRPARTCRDTDKPAWTRYSRRKPRKSYVKSLPHNALRHYNMGSRKKDYDMVVKLVAKEDVQLRANSLESARMSANRYLEANTLKNYAFKIHKYPFQVIRETKRQTGAGADRISSGMQKAFGKPMYRAARLRKGHVLFSVTTYKKYLKHVKEAYRKATSKLSKDYRVEIEEK